MKLSGTHQLLVYADDVNIFGGSVQTVNTASLLVTSKETSLEVNAGTTEYMVMSRHRNAEQSRNIKGDNSSFERVEEFKCLGTNLINQDSGQEEIKSRLKSRNAACHSVQNLKS